MDFMDYVDEHILALWTWTAPLLPAGHDANDLAPSTGAPTPRPAPDALNAIGAGGIYATASDLASFGGALTARSCCASPLWRHGLSVQPGPVARKRKPDSGLRPGLDNMVVSLLPKATSRPW